MHHNPVPNDSPAIDSYGLKNADNFFKILSDYSHIRMVLYGHVHQEFTSFRGNVVCMACPASCIQFLPKAEEFAVDKLPPGYRWIQLYDDGSFDTSVRYVY